ncbi:MAG: redoxin domain-containing protein [Candidatus Methanofastidiosum sp.]|nr:redoxin domain-containing protein [Methanofastidiosum sp.]
MPYEKHLEGEKALNFCLYNKDEKKVCLNEIKSDWIVLFFFDKSILESENSDILYYSKVKDDFKELKAELVGVGPVSQKEISNFCLEHNPDIMLLSDFDYKVSEEYGVVFLDKENNKRILPMTFLINKKGIVSKVWNREKMYYRFSGYADNLIELWEQSKMWAHITKVIDAIELLDKAQNS